MKFGFAIPSIALVNPELRHPWEASATPRDMLRIAQAADRLGYDWLSVPEHMVMLQNMVPVFGPRWPHTLTAMAFFAGATQRIRFASSVVVVTLHHPVELAKMYATLDYLSGGRAIAGLGVGYVRREFAIMNADHTNRGAIADEYIAAMIELWSSDNPSFNGEHVKFERIAFEPRPVQKPHPPIWIGGHSRPSMRRAARFGDAWAPNFVTRAQLPEMLEFIRSQPGFQEKPRKFDVVMPLFEAEMDMRHNIIAPPRISEDRGEILEAVGQLKAAGATGTTVTFNPTRTLDEYLERLQWFAEEVIPSAKR